MKTQPLVKIGASRQVVIPKNIHDRLGLSAGDYLEVGLEGSRVVFTPKTFVDRYVEKRIEKGLEDIAHGRVHGPFSSAKELVESLHTGAKKSKKRNASRVH